MRVIRGVVTIGAIAGLILGATTATASARASVVRPGQSIQAAVDAAAPGSTVVIGRGTFHESVLIAKPLRLVGNGSGTVLEPGGPPGDCAPIGICVFAPGGKVSISNLTVRGFDSSGIFALQATEGFSVTGVRAENDGAYGVAAFESHGISFINNFASNAEEAGFYIGDTDDAAGLVAANTAVGSAFGIFLRDSRHGQVVGNKVSGNCVGILGLDTNSTTSTGDDVSAGDWRLLGNKVRNNSKACPPNEEAPPLSGLGIALFGPDNYQIMGNVVTGNTPSGPSAVTGGVAVIDSTPFDGTTPNGNVVKANVIKGNDPDIFWDGSGMGNVFAHNVCVTSVPSGLC